MRFYVLAALLALPGVWEGYLLIRNRRYRAAAVYLVVLLLGLSVFVYDLSSVKTYRYTEAVTVVFEPVTHFLNMIFSGQ
ncbi:MAG: hypothetical protein ACM3QZ_08400 [Solirubrobacterales bacterium]